MGQQVAHRHRGVLEAGRPRKKAHVAPAGLAALAAAVAAVRTPAAAALAEDGEGEIPAPAGVLGPAPV